MKPTNPYLDSIINHPFPVLDHGSVTLLDYMGTELDIVRAARVSTGHHGDLGKEATVRARIFDMMRKGHKTPFEMCEIKLHVKLPIFVARQWVRHRTASIVEISGRFTDGLGEYYQPWPCQDLLDEIQEEREFRKGQGDPNERARILLPLSTYTEWVWKIDISNLLNFLEQRLDDHAQWEIRQYAQIIAGMVENWLPVTWEAFREWRLDAVTIPASRARELDQVFPEWKRLGVRP